MNGKVFVKLGDFVFIAVIFVEDRGRYRLRGFFYGLVIGRIRKLIVFIELLLK